MEMLFAWLSVLTDTQSPQLPLPQVEAMYLRLSWGVVLAAMTVCMSDWMRTPTLVRRWLGLILLLLCFLPGDISPAYWLGMAFRAPSLLFTGVALHYLTLNLKAPRAGGQPMGLTVPTMAVLVVLGWVLALDTFAVWPLSLWSWGFAPLTVMGLLLMSLMPWWMSRGSGGWLPWAPVVLFLGYALFRLPDGNVWSVVSDPWFWVWLHVMLLRRWAATLSRTARTAG